MLLALCDHGCICVVVCGLALQAIVISRAHAFPQYMSLELVGLAVQSHGTVAHSQLHMACMSTWHMPVAGATGVPIRYLCHHHHHGTWHAALGVEVSSQQHCHCHHHTRPLPEVDGEGKEPPAHHQLQVPLLLKRYSLCFVRSMGYIPLPLGSLRQCCALEDGQSPNLPARYTWPL